MNVVRVRIVAGALLVIAAACDRQIGPWEPPPESQLDAQLREVIERWGVMPIGPMPAQNPALVELGRVLMFDKILSGNRDISCATCHLPATHLADGLSLSVGTGGSGLGTARTLGPGRQFHARSAPSLLNGGLGLFYMFWDGRVSGFGSGPFWTPAGAALPTDLPSVLAAQAMFPVTNRQEMRGEAGDTDQFGNPNELAQLGDTQFVEIWQGVMQRLLAIPEYVSLFRAAYPSVPTSQLGFQHAAQALAAFEKEAFTKTNSPFDRYLARDDGALTPEEKRGALVFFGDTARCASCHSGPFLGGSGFANIGTPQLGPGTGAAAPLDLGRASLLNQDFYRFAFRVAPLRNVELTAPYMHDGAYASLEAVVRHYNNVDLALRTYDASQLAPALQGMYHGDDATVSDVLTTLDFRLRTPLGLSDDDQRALVAFLKALTDPAARDLSALTPARVPSGLPVP